MGFGEFLGSMAGRLAAQAEEMNKYKAEYERMSDTDLKREYNALKNKNGEQYRLRRSAVIAVLKDRGIIK